MGRATRLTRYTCLFALLALLLIDVPAALAQRLATGPQVLTFYSAVDDTEQPYGLYLPPNFDEQKQYPLVIMLHGAGSNHRLALRRVFGKSNAPDETDVEASRYFPEWQDVDYIVASPLARGTAGYQGIPEQDVYDVLADVKRRFKIDENRVYLTGLSMGGGGTLWLGLTRPDVWAAIAAVCPAPPAGTDQLAGNALNFPVHFFQGEADPVVPVQGTRDWVKRLEELGTQVMYAEYPGVDHTSWVQAYQDNFIFSWFDKFKRNPFPDQVRFSSQQHKYNKAYWVRFDQLILGELASIDARFTEPNRLQITTTNLPAFTLRLGGHPKYNPDKPLQLTINGKKVRAEAADSISLSLRKRKWIVAPYQPAATAKHAQLAGPMREAVAGRHIYVYGTADNPSQEVLSVRMQQATDAANWSEYRGAFLGRVTVFPRVLADKEVRPSDRESADLVLFGTKETNSLIAEISDRLPVHLNPADTASYGLAYVFPNNGQYVLISSGLPWWRGHEAQGLAGLMPDVIKATVDLKDFVLFKGSRKGVIAEGYFDNDWRLTEADRKKLNATGVVTIPVPPKSFSSRK